MSRSQRLSQRLNKQKKPEFEFVREFIPITERQTETFEAWYANSNLVLHGVAGTGKTFISMFLGLEDVLQHNSKYDNITIVRSAVPTRAMGFLPGTAEEKGKIFELPYSAICTELFGRGDAYEILKKKNMINFITTSFVRGTTLNNCIVIADEINNMSFHELDSVITRLGKNCKVIFSGDYRQTDLSGHERDGLPNFLSILESMGEFHNVEFDIDDIVRSKLVKSYIIEKDRRNLT